MNKHLKLFANHSAYSQAESNLDKPNVALCQQEGDIHFNPYDPFNGHEYVDLGLPSGTLWATMNVGASSETDYKTYDSTDIPYAGTEDPLTTSIDTAVQEWGGNWHMPTQTQIQELTANTTYQWVTNYQDSGINGGLFTSQNGNNVFFPACGYWSNGNESNVGNSGRYWSSSPNDSATAYLLYFLNGYKTVYNSARYNGFCVRPVAN